MPKGGRAEIVDATLNTSALWRHCTLLELKQNMRIQSSNDPIEQGLIKEFMEWLLKVGDGTIGLPHDGTTEIEMSSQLLLFNVGDPIKTIVEAIYPCLENHLLFGDNYLTSHAILAPTNEVVGSLNEYICSNIQGEVVEYLSSDNDHFDDRFDDLYSTEFLNSINCSGKLHHKLRLKVEFRLC